MTYLPDHPAGYRMSAFGQYEDDDSASTLKQRDHKDATDLVVTHALTSSASKGATEDGTGRGTPIVPDRPGVLEVSGPLTTGGIISPRGSETSDSGWVIPDVAATWWDDCQTADSLTTTSDAQRMPDKQRFQAVMQPQAFDEMNFTTDDETHHVLRAGTKQSTGVVQETTHAIVEPTLTAHETGQGWWNKADYAGTLRAEGENRPSRPSNVMVQQYGVRRLTPVECERLQSFPDGWTEPAGSDSARYKAMGNAVTVNVVRWILNRMVQAG